MDKNVNYKELESLLNLYLADKKLHRTEERFVILNRVCSFSSFFDVNMLQESFKNINFTVSLATLYNTINLFVDAGVLVAHHFSTASTHYELKLLAEKHAYLICNECKNIRILREAAIKKLIRSAKVNRFTPDYYAIYIYGLCNKCKAKLQRKKNNNNKEKITK